MRAHPTRWTAVINPAAGRGRGRARLPHLADALAARRPRRRTSSVSADADDLARDRARRVRRRARRRRVRGRRHRVRSWPGSPPTTTACSASCPAGSGNDFARHLDIPRGDLGRRHRRAAHRRASTRVDLGRAETADGTTTWFTTVANTGFDAEANRWANTVDWTSGHAALRARHAPHARHVPAAPRPRHRRRRRASRPTRGWSRWATRARYASGMMITPAPRSTTACSTCASSARVARSTSSARSRRCSAARTSTTRRCTTWRGTDGRRSRRSTPLDAARAVGERRARRPAARARSSRCAGALRGGRARRRRHRYLTVSVPSMPAARWPVMCSRSRTSRAPGRSSSTSVLAAAVDLEPEARVRAVEHEVVDAVRGCRARSWRSPASAVIVSGLKEKLLASIVDGLRAPGPWARRTACRRRRRRRRRSGDEQRAATRPRAATSPACAYVARGAHVETVRVALHARPRRGR